MDNKKLTTEETFTLAVQNQQKNNFQVAEKLYKETLKSNPNHVDAHNNLGLYYYDQENPKMQKVALKRQSKLILIIQVRIIIWE